MRRLFCYISFFVTLSLFMSCKPGVPSGIISPGKMEDVLYDYHLSQAAADNGGNQEKISYDRHLYFYALLKKYDLTEAQFDKSMEYYERHSELMRDIYNGINKRLQADAGKSAQENESGKYAHLTANGDTAIVWRGSNTFLLSKVPFNKMSFYIKADTTYHKGDSFELSMDAQFVFEDGMRDAVALLAVRYDNDSVASQNVHISSASHYRVSVMPALDRKIKEIRGFVFLSQGGNSKTTLKLACITNIALVRFHKTKNTPTNVTSGAPGNVQPGPQKGMLPGSPNNIVNGQKPISADSFKQSHTR